MWSQKCKMKIIFKGVVPSKKNGTRRLARRGRDGKVHIFQVPSLQHEVWEEEYLYKLPKLSVPISKCIINVYYYFPDNRRRDTHNEFESIADILVKAKIIQDDRWQVIKEQHHYPMGIDKDFPRVEVEVLESQLE